MPSEADRPVGDREFAELIRQAGFPMAFGGKVAVAVSGGMDSTALACLASSWRPDLVCFVVDHGLRAESAEEARLTVQRLMARGISARFLRMDARFRSPSSGGLQEKARAGRYAALEEACYQAGIPFLLVAHHRDDQMETLEMRRQGGSGVLGMAGMKASAPRDRIVVFRPLLSIAKSRLKATLQEKGVEWVEDPSNINPAFSRVRIRQDISETNRGFLRELEHSAIPAAAALMQGITGFLAHAVQWRPEGWATLDQDKADDFERAVAVAALRQMIWRIGGKEYPPAQSAVAALWARGRGTLGGTLLFRRALERNGKHVLALRRELRDLAPAIAAQKAARWDGRWRYLGESRKGCFIASLAPALAMVREDRAVPASVLRSLPALWQGKEIIALPEGMGGLRKDLPRVSFVWGAGVPAAG